MNRDGKTEDTNPFEPPQSGLSSPAGLGHKSTGRGWSTFGAAVLWAMMSIKLLFLGPTIRRTLEEFDLEFSLVTRAVTHPLAAAVCALLAAALAINHFADQGPVGRRITARIGWVIGIVVLLIVLSGLFGPLVNLLIGLRV